MRALMDKTDTCPVTKLRHSFPSRKAAWDAVRGQRDMGDTFRVYHCECGAWHWHRIVSLVAVRRGET